MLDPEALLWAHREPGGFVTYPARCLRVAEMLSLLALAVEGDEAREVADYVRRFVAAQPGCAHPLSDRWAVSLIPTAIVVAASDQAQFDEFLKRVVRWVADRFDQGGLGLGSVDADPAAEIEYLIGAALEHIRREPRREAFAVAVVLDLATAARRADLYDVARNDFLAVNALPEIFHVEDSRDQYLRDGAFTMEVNPNFAERWPEDGTVTAPHQTRPPYYLSRVGRHWDLLAVQAVLRNRYFYGAIASLLTAT